MGKLKAAREKALKRLFEELKPSKRDLARLDKAIAAHAEWKDFGLPERGGSRNQPAIWHHMIRIVEAAIRDANAESSL